MEMEDTKTQPDTIESTPAPRRRSLVLPNLNPRNLRRFSKLLRRLGTCEDAVAGLPQITPYITQVLKLSRERVISYLAMSTDPEIQRWLEVWEREDIPDAIRR